MLSLLQRLGERLESRPRVTIAVATVIGGLPLIVAVIALAQADWHPVGDLAQATLRQESFWANPPLVGPAGRIGTFGHQGNHPGPAMFWFSWPVWQLLGRSPWAYQASVTLLTLGAYAASVWTAFRLRGLHLALAVAAVGALAMRAFGATALTQPWNPYMPLVPYLLFLLLCWSVAAGRHRVLPAAVVVGSFCVQCHVGYAPAVAAGLVVAVAGAVWTSRTPTSSPEHPGSGVRQLLVWFGWAVVAGAVMWMPPIIDQIRHDPGNLRIIYDTFRSPADQLIGLRAGANILATQLDPTGNVLRGGETVIGAPIGGMVLLLVWAVTSLAVRTRHHLLALLNILLAGQLITALYWAMRLDSKRYLYLVEWFWMLTVLLVISVVWSGFVVARHRSPAKADGWMAPAAVLAGVAVLAVSLSFSYDAAQIDPPDTRYSNTVRALSGPTRTELDPDLRYLVSWVDPDALGGNGFGMLLELDRHGFDVGAIAPFSAAVEPHRVRYLEEVDAVVTVVSGDDNIAELQAMAKTDPTIEELAYDDHRSTSQASRYHELEAEVLASLRATGRDDLALSLSASIWTALIDPDVSEPDYARLSEMLSIGQATAVFRSPGQLPSR
ncbi:MAG: hypothetical protein ABI239_05640 [Aquihabitans sp.]